MSNIQALSDFVSYCGIKRDAFGRCRFRADVEMRASGHGGVDVVDVTISFASGDREQLSLGEGSDFQAGQVPLGYSTDHGSWEHADGVLTIRGNYRGRFDYETEVRVEQ